MGSTGEVVDQDMLAPDCSPIHLRLLGELRYLALGLSSSCYGLTLYVGDLHAVV